MKGEEELILSKKRPAFFMILIQGIAFCFAMRSAAFEPTDKINIGGVLAGAYQYQIISSAPGFEDTGRGAAVFQPELLVTLTEQDEVFAKFGFAAGNALNDGISPFHIAPWAADLEDNVKDINGRSRDYLLTAWYKHTFAFSPDNALGITGGIIDATDYLDENAYAGDEYTQFMNAALVHKVHDFFPSYDLGAAAEWNIGPLDVKGVVMNVGSGDDNTYNYYGLQFGYRLNTILGEGNYRIIADRTSSDFEDPQGQKDQAMGAMVLSFDQQLGDILGAWIRFGRQDDDAAVDFQNLYSGGINILGKPWGRDKDDMGLAYALMNSGNLAIDKAHVLEAYYRAVLNEFLAISVDFQYLQDDLNDGESPRGWILGTRLTVIF
jgi:porin